MFLGNLPPRDSTKCQKWLLENQIADQPYARHVRWAICPANVLAREAVIIRRKLAQSSSNVVGRAFSAEMWNVDLPEGGAVSRAPKSS